MISKTYLLLILLALTSTFVSAVTQAQCGSLCSKLQKYSSYSSAIYNGIGKNVDQCICKNPENANRPLGCIKTPSPASLFPLLFHADKTGNWSCFIDSTCATLLFAINLGNTFKPYDYYNIGKYGDKCSVSIYDFTTKPISNSDYSCQKFKTAYTGTSHLYYSPATTGIWQCRKTS